MLNAILAALGGGAASLGSSMEQDENERQRAAQRMAELQQQESARMAERQAAIEATKAATDGRRRAVLAGAKAAGVDLPDELTGADPADIQPWIGTLMQQKKEAEAKRIAGHKNQSVYQALRMAGRLPHGSDEYDEDTDYNQIAGIAKQEDQQTAQDALQDKRLAAVAKHAGSAVAGSMQQQRDFQRAQGLKSDYQNEPAVKDAHALATVHNRLSAALNETSPIADLDTQYELVKLFDPGSAVREGEIRLTKMANSLPNKAKLLLDNVRTGRMLTDDQKDQIRSLLASKMRNGQNLVAPIQRNYGEQVRRFGLTPQDSAYVAPNPFAGVQLLTKKGPNIGRY